MYLQKYHSPIGDLCMRSDGEVITGLWFVGSKDEKKHKIELVEKELPIFEETKRWLDIYFSGEKPNFIPAYRVEGCTPFRKRVIDLMNKIPYGEVVTYKQIADNIAKEDGKEKMSSQAVGGAVGWNPICLLIPCHRVVGTNGSLTGYGGGIMHKVKLLELEGHDMTQFDIP